jgi:GNAT superfamily N-acetyltransferase
MKTQVVVDENISDEDRKVIHERFEAINMDATNNDYNKPEDWFTLVLRDHQGDIVGGIQISTIYYAQYLEVLWVDKRYRKLGYGRDLLLEAERISKENGCISSHTYTFKWQGVNFYPRVGYKEIAVFDGYHEGLTEHIFMKKLDKEIPPISYSDPDRFRVSRDDSPEAKKIVGNSLGSDFEENAGSLLKKYPQKRYAIALKDDAGKVLGGIKGYTIMGTMFIEEFWVEERIRRQGYGSLLLEHAKKIAMEHGCISFQTFCMSYNNFDFMTNRGFTTYGETDGYPNGVKEYYLIKRL